MSVSPAQIAALHPVPPGLWHDEHHRYFYGDRGPLPSVTTIAKALDRSGPLVGWAKRETAACAIRNHEMLGTMIEASGTEAAQAWLARIPDYIRDTAAEQGTAIHQMIARDIVGEDIAPTGVQVPFMRGWRRFRRSIGSGKILLSETAICNLTLGYGGTLDLGIEIDGVPTLVDVKTGGVYNEVAIQLAGYDGGEFWASGDSPTKHRLPQWGRYAVLDLKPDEARLIPIDVNDQARAAFRALLIAHDWAVNYAPWAKGRPIVVPSSEGAQSA